MHVVSGTGGIYSNYVGLYRIIQDIRDLCDLAGAYWELWDTTGTYETLGITEDFVGLVQDVKEMQNTTGLRRSYWELPDLWDLRGLCRIVHHHLY